MVDQDVVPFSRGQQHEKVTTLKDDQNRNDVINGISVRHGHEQTLKKIWIYSSARRFGGFKKKTDKNGVFSAPASISRSGKHLEMKSSTSLNGSRLNQKGQAKLDALLNHKIQPTKIISSKRRVVEDHHAGDKRKKAEDTPLAEKIGPESIVTHPVAGSQANDQELRGNARKMAGEIMRYELQLAGLHGRVAALQKENERLRNDRTLCEKLASKIVDEKKKDSSRNPEARTPESSQKADSLLEIKGIYCGETSTNEVNETNDIIELKDGSSLEDRKTAYEKLKRLESRIVERLEEYKKLTVDAEANCSSLAHRRKDIQKESPFVVELKLKLLRLHQELAQLRSWTNVRLVNMKNAIQKERLLRHQLKQELTRTQELAGNWKAYAVEAQQYTKQYKAQVDVQDDALIKLRNNQKEVDRFIYKLKNDYNELLAVNRKLTHGGQTGENNTYCSHADLEDEMFKSRALEATVRLQKNENNHLKSIAEPRAVDKLPLPFAEAQNGPLFPILPFATPIVSNTRSAEARPGNEMLAHRTIEGENIETNVKTANLMNDTRSAAMIIKQESPIPTLNTDQAGVTLESPDTTVAIGGEP